MSGSIPNKVQSKKMGRPESIDRVDLNMDCISYLYCDVTQMVNAQIIDLQAEAKYERAIEDIVGLECELAHYGLPMELINRLTRKLRSRLINALELDRQDDPIQAQTISELNVQIKHLTAMNMRLEGIQG